MHGWDVAMAEEKAEGMIVRVTRLTDTSLIVTWVTERHGLIKTVAKGALRAKSAFAGRLDLFYRAEFSMVLSRSSELHSLREVRLTETYEPLRKNYSTLELAVYFGVLLEMVMEPGQADVELYDLLLRGIGHLSEKGGGRRAMLHYEAELCRILGVRDQKVSAYVSLEKAFGRLPSNRGRCVEIFKEGS